MEASKTKPRKLRAVFSYRLATRRHSFTRRQKRSAQFLSRYRSRSYARGSLRFFRDGITASVPRLSIRSTTAWLSYPLSAITTSAGTPVHPHRGLGHICLLASGQRHFHRQSQPAHPRVALGAEAAATAAGRLFRLATAAVHFFWRRRRVWWARTTVESRISHSRSGSLSTSKTTGHVSAPTVEAFPGRVPFTEAFGQVSPGGTGFGDPENGIEEQTVIFGRRAELSGPTQKEILDTLPVGIRNRMALQHVSPPWFEVRSTFYPNYLPLVHTT